MKSRVLSVACFGLLLGGVAACSGESPGTSGPGGASGGSVATTNATGGGGSAGGQGGAVTGGAGSTGGDTSSGGSTSSSGGAGGTGGEAGQGGVGGCVADPYVCDPLDCGLVANDCGFYTNCNVGPSGETITCATQAPFSPEGPEGGPMTCNIDTHRCECAPGNAEVQEMCGGSNSLPYVIDWCTKHGGCYAAYCGDPPVAKVPESCQDAGQNDSTDTLVWCCAKSCVAATDCDDKNECTTNACGPDSLCAFDPTPQMPCNGGAGVCIAGNCEMF
jgi:hypothetical protein